MMITMKDDPDGYKRPATTRDWPTAMYRPSFEPPPVVNGYKRAPDSSPLIDEDLMRTIV